MKTVVDWLVSSEIVITHAAAKRLVHFGVVKVNEQLVKDVYQKVPLGAVITIGKHRRVSCY